MYLGSVDQYEEQFQFILDLINSGLPYDRVVCSIYICVCVYTHTHTSFQTYPTAMCDITSYEISYAQYCIILCSDEYLCLYMSLDAEFV